MNRAATSPRRAKTTAVAVVLFLLGASDVDAQTCTPHAAFQRIPRFQGHVDFPVDARASARLFCGATQFSVIEGPPALRIDATGGLFYWTPTRAARERIVLGLEQSAGTRVSRARKRLRVNVDDNTMVDPLFRDYLEEPTEVTIHGRAHGEGFEYYTIEWAEQATPDVRHPIVEYVTTPVTTTGALATWNVGALPDGGRYVLTLTVEARGPRSILTNPVILDRTAKLGWPKRIEAISHSPVLADLDDDGDDEVLVVTHVGELYAWRIDGWELWEAPALQAAFSAPSVGDVDGDGRPEIVWATEFAIRAYGPDGVPLPGFPIASPNPRLDFRAAPALADLDGDGVLDVVIGANSLDTSGGVVVAYRCVGGAITSLPGWPQVVDDASLTATPAVGDIDGDGLPEVVVENRTRVYAWHANGTAVTSGLHRALLPVPIEDGKTNGGTGTLATSQPALADLDGDGTIEIVVGGNVLRANGTPAAGWEGGRPTAVNAASAAIGDLDGNAANGLEVVLGRDAWHADGSPVVGWPSALSLSSAVLGDGGDGNLDSFAGTRDPEAPGVAAFDANATPIAAYPKSLFGFAGDVSAPVIGDFDADGLVDVAAAITDVNYGGIVAVWDMPGPNQDEHHAWPMLGHDVRHTGMWTPPAPNRPVNLQVSGNALTWEDRSSIENAYVVERSMTGAAWTWVAVAHLPADTTQWTDPAWLAGARYRVRAERIDPRSGRAILSKPAAATP
jgi:hypothetical protein